MAKKSKGLLALLIGAAAGAAAVFLSDKDNRAKTKAGVVKATKTAQKLKSDLEKNPKATVDKLKRQGSGVAKKALKSAEKTAKKSVNKAARVVTSAKKSVAKKATSAKKTAAAKKPAVKKTAKKK